MIPLPHGHGQLPGERVVLERGQHDLIQQRPIGSSDLIGIVLLVADAAQNILDADAAGFAGQSITTTRPPISCEDAVVCEQHLPNRGCTAKKGLVRP